eukprot:TRINITY_DN1178_c0_g1_i7.p1 TRINITY_DN1178_c0_g1~~TRINITY_DN1178_c0_g1_i7.p1  ORF type:complete len:463 (-),score=142.39 TRINITY_DN1178_c0_g1_i7:78-1466(-)
MGDIEPWMDENFLYSLFAHTGENFNVKLIKDKVTGQNSNFCFVNFVNPLAAQKVIENFNGHPIPNTNKVFRLNWAAYGMGDKTRKPGMPPPVMKPVGKFENDCSLFVGDLAQDVTDYFMMSTFQYYYPSCYAAKVVMDPKTNLSKGYGFVYFTDDGEKTRALNEMQGYYLSYRPIRLNLATKKGESKPGAFVPGLPPVSGGIPPLDLVNVDSSVTTVFIGGLDNTILPEQLQEIFKPFGEVKALKIPYGKTVAFVEYADHMSALKALSTLGHPNLGQIMVNNIPLRISWGKPAKPLPPGAVTTPPAGTIPGQPWPKPAYNPNFIPSSNSAAYDASMENSTENQSTETAPLSQNTNEQKEQKEEEKPIEVATTNEEANLAPSIEEQEELEKRKPEEEADDQAPNKKRRVDEEKEENEETKSEEDLQSEEPSEVIESETTEAQTTKTETETKENESEIIEETDA